MELVATGSLLGIRETRRILGDYVLCLDDFKRRAVFADEIGRYCYPVDIHAAAPEEAQYRQFEQEFADLRYSPGRELRHPLPLPDAPRAGQRAGGRPLRLAPTATAGLAARHAGLLHHRPGGRHGRRDGSRSRESTRGIDVRALQERLKEVGTFLPNA